jgi:hypothetical protein
MSSESSTSTNLALAETTRRNFLYIATATVGAVGAAAIARGYKSERK